jgi:hypothetical protein
MLTIQNSHRQNEEITMLARPTQSKRLLSHIIAEIGVTRLNTSIFFRAPFRPRSCFDSTPSAALWAAVSRMTPGFLLNYRPRGSSCATSGGNKIKYPEFPIAVKV